MASAVLRGSAFHRAVPTAAAARVSGVEGVVAALSGLHPRCQLHSSARTRSSLDEFDAVYEVVRGTKVSLVEPDLLQRIMECSLKARKEFVQKEMRRTWMICAATVGGFFAGSLTRTRKIDNERKRAHEGNL